MYEILDNLTLNMREAWRDGRLVSAISIEAMLSRGRPAVAIDAARRGRFGTVRPYCMLAVRAERRGERET